MKAALRSGRLLTIIGRASAAPVIELRGHMFKIATFCLVLGLCGVAQADEDAIAKYKDYLPHEIAEMSKETQGEKHQQRWCVPMGALRTFQHGEAIVHAVIRTYSGQGAKELFDILEQRRGEVQSAIQAVSGFQSYILIRTEDGGVTVTVCQDKAGTDESSQVAREWIQQNVSDLDVSPPVVSEGPAVLQLR